MNTIQLSEEANFKVIENEPLVVDICVMTVERVSSLQDKIAVKVRDNLK